MKKTLLLIVTIVLAISIMAVGCQKQATQDGTFNDELQAAGKIIVGTSPDYPPFESLDEAGNLIGFDIEVMEAVADKMGIELEWSQMDFSLIISAMNSGQIDAGMSCFTFDPERDVIFSTPYLMSAQAVVVSADSDINTVADLKGKKLIAGLGTTGEKAANEIEGVEIVLPDDYMVGFEMLKNGQGDAVVCDYGVGVNYASQDGFKMLDETLQKEEMSVILKTGNTKLEEAINKAIEEFKQTEEYTALVEKWELD